MPLQRSDTGRKHRQPQHLNNSITACQRCSALNRGVKMNIDSARALKEEIASQVVPPAVSAIQRAGGFSITTFSLNRMTKAEPLVALGIAQGTGHDDVRVAVRLQRRSLEHSQSMIEHIRQRARNEVDVRFVGRVAKYASPVSPATTTTAPRWFSGTLQDHRGNNRRDRPG